MKLNTIVFGALIALSTSALQASEVKSNGDVKQPEILASVSTDKVVPLTAQEAKDSRGAYLYTTDCCGQNYYWFNQPINTAPFNYFGSELRYIGYFNGYGYVSR